MTSKKDSSQPAKLEDTTQCGSAQHTYGDDGSEAKNPDGNPEIEEPGGNIDPEDPLNGSGITDPKKEAGSEEPVISLAGTPVLSEEDARTIEGILNKYLPIGEVCVLMVVAEEILQTTFVTRKVIITEGLPEGAVQLKDVSTIAISLKSEPEKPISKKTVDEAVASRNQASARAEGDPPSASLLDFPPGCWSMNCGNGIIVSNC